MLNQKKIQFEDFENSQSIHLQKMKKKVCSIDSIKGMAGQPLAQRIFCVTHASINQQRLV